MEGIAAQILNDAPPSFALAGLSMGGYIAFEILRRAPERVTKLALIDTSARPDTQEQTDRRLSQIDMVGQGRFDEIPNLQYPLLVHSRRLNDDRLRGAVFDMARAVGPDAFVGQLRAIMTRPDSRPLLPSIASPVTIIVGDSDQLTPPHVAREMHEAIASSTLSVIPQCGHLSTLEEPDAVTACLRSWLES